jgi:hypothetical protein
MGPIPSFPGLPLASVHRTVVDPVVVRRCGPAAVVLVVLSDYLVADPRMLRDLHNQGVAHLAVRVRDGTGLVGPLVIPGGQLPGQALEGNTHSLRANCGLVVGRRRGKRAPRCSRAATGASP